jgi:hypothetical protein
LYKADLLLCESGGGIVLVAFNIGSFITNCLNQSTIHLGAIRKNIVLPESC